MHTRVALVASVLACLLAVACARTSLPQLPVDFDGPVTFYTPVSGSDPGYIYFDTSNMRWRLDTSATAGGPVTQTDLYVYQLQTPTHFKVVGGSCTNSSMVYDEWLPISLPPAAVKQGTTVIGNNSVAIWTVSQYSLTLRYYVYSTTNNSRTTDTLVRFTVSTGFFDMTLLQIDFASQNVRPQNPTLFNPAALGCSGYTPIVAYEIGGFVKSAIDVSPITGASVTLTSLTDSTVSLFTMSDLTGAFHFYYVYPGLYNISVSATGFSTFYAPSPLNVTEDIPAGTYADIVLNPILKAGQNRIVLTWNAFPRDLDARLHTPWNCEVAYYNTNCTSGSASSQLQADVSSGFGPETIFTSGLSSSGSYQFSVYSYQAAGFAGAAQAARVQIWTSTGLVGTYNPPLSITCPTCNWWRVFSINGATGRLTPINQLANSEF